MRIADAGNGALKFDLGGGYIYTVQTDGSKTVTATATVAFQKQGDGSYHETVWVHGKELSQSDWTLSGGDTTLTVHKAGSDPNHDAPSIYSRVSGDHGVTGEWVATSVKVGHPATCTIKMGPGDQMTWETLDRGIKTVWRGKTDGSRHTRWVPPSRRRSPRR